MTTTTSSAKKVPGSSASESRRQSIRTYIQKHLNAHFSGTLAKENDIVNIVTALVYQESSFNANAQSPLIAASVSKGSRQFLGLSAISKVYKEGTPQQRSNIENCLRAIGLMQVRASYFVKGGHPSGKAELETMRSDLAGPLVVNPGEAPQSKILGESNMSNAILAGLIVLEAKWKLAKPANGRWQVGSHLFSTRIAAAVGAYLGLGKDVVTGMTTEQYVANIVGGKKYQVANGSSAPASKDSQTQTASTASNGATQTAASGNTQVPAGC